MNDEVRRQLEVAGRRPVPSPRAGYTDALEQRLTTLARARDPGVVRPAWWRRLPMRFAAGVATAALAITFLLGTGLDGGRTTLALELTGSVNVEVALIDGTTLVDPDGLVLPEGAVVRVGANGSARVGGIVLGAGDVARVVDGHLRADPRPSDPIVAPGESAAPTDAPPGSRPPPSDAPTATPAATREPPATDAPGTTPETTTRTTEPAVRSPTPKPAAVAPMKIEARAVSRSEIAVRWTGMQGADRYVLIATSSRSGPAPDPVYPGSRTVGDFTRPPDTPLKFRVGESLVEVRLQVVALDRDSSVLARSPIATVVLAD